MRPTIPSRIRLTGYLTLTFCLLMGVASSVSGQTPWQKLDNADTALRDDRQEGVDVLSPKAFKRAFEILEKAKKQFAKDGKVSELQRHLQAFTDARNAARYNANTAKRTVPAVIRARTGAIRANAPEVAVKLFTDGEKEFKELIDRIEQGKLAEAVKRGPATETKFRDAELEAIKISTINVAKEKLKEAERTKAREYAPISYRRADSLITATDRLLSENRYAGKQATQMSHEAEYQARLSIYLTTLTREAQERKDIRERQFLKTSARVSRIARELGVDATYDEGYQEITKAMLFAVKNLKQENLTLSKEVAQRNQTIETLRKNLGETSETMQQDLEETNQHLAALKRQLSEREAGLLAQIEQTQQQLATERRKLSVKHAFEQKIKNVETIFTAEEAAVLQERGNLIIRLYGLNFKSGQSVIQPEYFGLLSKIQRAIREFPRCEIAVEGHTDGVGYQEFNQTLSEDRAAAVREYLLANMGLEPNSVNAVGYGPSRPIANNATPEGRAKNRRIDIVITPHKN